MRAETLTPGLATGITGRPPGVPERAKAWPHICAGCRSLSVYFWSWWEDGNPRPRVFLQGVAREGKAYCLECVQKGVR